MGPDGRMAERAAAELTAPLGLTMATVRSLAQRGGPTPSEALSQKRLVWPLMGHGEHWGVGLSSPKEES